MILIYAALIPVVLECCVFVQIDGNDRLLWFWALWEAAQFCVLSRLRTPLGKPQDTFAAFEMAVKHCSAAVQGHDTTTMPASKTASSSLQGLLPPKKVVLLRNTICKKLTNSHLTVCCLAVCDLCSECYDVSVFVFCFVC